MRNQQIDRFFEYASERYRIKLRRDIDHKPYCDANIPNGNGQWTDDPILQKYRFCNVFREDDKTTQWIRKRITEPVYTRHLVGAMIIARWFNRIETLEMLLPSTGTYNRDLFFYWHGEQDIDGWIADMYIWLKDVKPLVTGAYMIKTPVNMNKLEGVLWCLSQILPDAIKLYDEFTMQGMTLEKATYRLKQYPYLGPFMSYEIVTDLRHSILSEAPDIMTWANPGPGAIRGLNRILPDGELYNRHRKGDEKSIQYYMRVLLSVSRDNDKWSRNWPTWEMRDVEHTLCEFDKYERTRLGEGKPKQLYGRST